MPINAKDLSSDVTDVAYAAPWCELVAENVALPVVPDNCPACFAKPTERQHFKELLREEEGRYKNLFRNLLHTLKPLMAEGSEQATQSELEL